MKGKNADHWRRGVTHMLISRRSSSAILGGYHGYEDPRRRFSGRSGERAQEGFPEGRVPPRGDGHRDRQTVPRRRCGQRVRGRHVLLREPQARRARRRVRRRGLREVDRVVWHRTADRLHPLRAVHGAHGSADDRAGAPGRRRLRSRQRVLPAPGGSAGRGAPPLHVFVWGGVPFADPAGSGDPRNPPMPRLSRREVAPARFERHARRRAHRPLADDASGPAALGRLPFETARN